MSFLESYKRLEQLCGDVMGDERKVTAYIEEMEKIRNGALYVPGWDYDFKTLKRCRHVRNRIVHETGCTEANSCCPGDAEWLDGFYDRIMSRTDPLALYRRATESQKTVTPKKSQYPQQPIYGTQTGREYDRYDAEEKDKRKAVGCFILALCVLVIAVAVIYFLKQDF